MAAWPEYIQPADCEFGRTRNDTMTESPSTRLRQIIRKGRPLWKARISWKVRARDVSEMRYQMELLGGGASYVKLRDYTTVQATKTGITVSGTAAVGAASFAATGWPAVVAIVLRAGEYVEVSGRLYVVLADVTTNGSGVGTITITTPLLAALTAGLAVELVAPGVNMRPMTPEWTGSRSVDQGLWQVSREFQEIASDTA